MSIPELDPTDPQPVFAALSQKIATTRGSERIEAVLDVAWTALGAMLAEIGRSTDDRAEEDGYMGLMAGVGLAGVEILKGMAASLELTAHPMKEVTL